jgi:methylated-DNA-[protein]-cysteine S-methyltransferase
MWSSILSDTPIGPLWVAVTSVGLARIMIGAPLETAGQGRAPAALAHALGQLNAYFSCKREQFDLPIDWRGLTPFSLGALLACAQIPYGQVRTYGQLASQLGRPNAPRAVGAAMAANHLPIVIPCHRVVGSDGKLHGYAAPNGTVTKAFLLKLEGGLVA